MLTLAPESSIEAKRHAKRRSLFSADCQLTILVLMMCIGEVQVGGYGVVRVPLNESGKIKRLEAVLSQVVSVVE